VSISKRILDLAKANLNALLDKAAAGGEPALEQLSDEELEAELERRRGRRLREQEEARVRESAERAARERAAEAARKRAKQRRTPPMAGAGMSERRLRELYAQLETPYGAPFEEVKKSFRRLMRKYHPDLHVGDPVKHKTATQLTMSLTQAYNQLEEYLAKRS
jgi:DnaJ-domain-containing protein 1